MLTFADHSSMKVEEERNRRLRPGPEWASFEQFRLAGSPGLETVGGGQVGTLRTKTGMFRILRDQDFQSLVGLASEVDGLKSGLAMLVEAAKVVRDHPASPSAIDLLLRLASQYAGSPLPASRRGYELVDEAGPVPEDDEVILDPAEIQRRAGRR